MVPMRQPTLLNTQTNSRSSLFCDRHTCLCAFVQMQILVVRLAISMLDFWSVSHRNSSQTFSSNRRKPSQKHARTRTTNFDFCDDANPSKCVGYSLRESHSHIMWIFIIKLTTITAATMAMALTKAKSNARCVAFAFYLVHTISFPGK